MKYTQPTISLTTVEEIMPLTDCDGYVCKTKYTCNVAHSCKNGFACKKVFA